MAGKSLAQLEARVRQLLQEDSEEEEEEGESDTETAPQSKPALTSPSAREFASPLARRPDTPRNVLLSRSAEVAVGVGVNSANTLAEVRRVGELGALREQLC